jgi:mannose-6-phosphate isomerase-like protein (cupin superfamily)
MTYPPVQYFGDEGAVSAAFRSAVVGPDLEIGIRSRVGYLATGESTGGHFGLYRWDMTGAGTGSATPPRGHYHTTFSESFFILSGAVELYDGDVWRSTKAGDFLYVPPGGVHAFDNVSGEPASMLVLFAPGAPRELFFGELAEIVGSGRALSDAEWAEIWARHDQYQV